jgi:hypothetical protein
MSFTVVRSYVVPALVGEFDKEHRVTSEFKFDTKAGAQAYIRKMVELNPNVELDFLIKEDEGVTLVKYIAFQIANPKILEIVSALNPYLRTFTFEELNGQFVVCNYPHKGTYTMVTQENFANSFEHMEPDGRIWLYQFFAEK